MIAELGAPNPNGWLPDACVSSAPFWNTTAFVVLPALPLPK